MSESDFAVGDTVSVVKLPSFLKTADPMPMLRPPDLIAVGEEGVILDRRPGSYWGVRFNQGSFLMESQYLTLVSKATVHSQPSHTDVETAIAQAVDDTPQAKDLKTD